MQFFKSEGGRGLTGSVIGVDLVNGGGYTFPPFVEIVDECGKGFGATARLRLIMIQILHIWSNYRYLHCY